MKKREAIPALCLVGATGTGKSAAGAALAASCNGVVVNCDSRQFYRDFPIITGFPAQEEHALCEHRLYGIFGCAEKLSAGSYAAMAAREIEEITANRRIPVLVGGTGLYLEVLLSGIASVPPVSYIFWSDNFVNS